MFVHELTTENPDVRLIKPDVERDAPASAAWLESEQGRQTLHLMGVPDSENKPSTLLKEQERVRDFLSRKDQCFWMIELRKKVVGAIWTDLVPTEHLGAPAIHLMIGDPSARSQGAGTAAFAAVVRWLSSDPQKNPKIYSRHLVWNEAAAALPLKAGFINDGPSYRDEHGLEWQNVAYHVEVAR
ncbi:MAG TPA: GNAT family protein [Candidatus Saccharimonadales bacterium]|nr:GNAT family protein [Candidatus Saccharimonadales bacterium]